MMMTRALKFGGAMMLAAGMTAGPAMAQYGQYGPPPQRYAQGPQWEGAPPAEFAAAQQRGYRDGVNGARRDFENHRPPNVNNRDEFRDPHFIARPDRRDYRFGFKRGYEEAVRHIYGRGPRR